MGSDPAYREAAWELGALLAGEGITLVYGGGNVGLMGAVADAVMQNSGEAIGVIPHGLARKEVAHTGITEMHVVDSMHERKAKMADLSDGFIAMPGGLGTLEEVFEVITWALLGIHHKPCGFLNIAGYWDGLIHFLDFSVEKQLIRPEHRAMILVDSEPIALMEKMRQYQSPIKEQWITRSET